MKKCDDMRELAQVYPSPGSRIYCGECRFFDEDFNVCKLPHGLSFSYLKKDDYCSYAKERIKDEQRRNHG